MGDIIRVNRKDGSASFKVRIRRKGQPLLTKTFQRRTDASKWLQSTEGKLLEGKGLPRIHRKTLAEALKRYEQEVIPNKKKTTQIVQLKLLSFWSECIGHMRLTDVIPDTIVNERRRLLESGVGRSGEEGAKRSSATANRYVELLRHVFNVCVKEWGWCESNPVARVKPLREPEGRQCILSDDEMKRIVRALETHSREDFRLIVLIALVTGCRRGNAQSVRWTDIDFERQTLCFPDTKNNRPVVVPLTLDLCERLKQRKEKLGNTSSFAFPSGPGSSVPYVDVKKQWRKFADSIAFENLRFHDLRHAVASYLAKNSVPLFTIGRMLGHKSLESTKRYAHLAVNDILAQTQMLGARLQRVK